MKEQVVYMYIIYEHIREKHLLKNCLSKLILSVRLNKCVVLFQCQCSKKAICHTETNTQYIFQVGAFIYFHQTLFSPELRTPSRKVNI